MIIYFIIVSSTCLSAKNKRSYLVWLLFCVRKFPHTTFFRGAGLSLAGLEKFVEVLFFSEAKLGAQPVAGTVDARARNVQADRYFLSAVLEEDQHTEYHIGVGKRRVIAAQVVDKTRIYSKKGSPERPEIIFKSLRTMENVGVNAARHLVSDGFYALKRGIALVEIAAVAQPSDNSFHHLYAFLPAPLPPESIAQRPQISGEIAVAVNLTAMREKRRGES